MTKIFFEPRRREGHEGKKERKKREVYKLNSIAMFPSAQFPSAQSPIPPTMSYRGDHINATPGGFT